MLIIRLLLVGNFKSEEWNVLQKHDLHTKFNANPSFGSNVVKTDDHLDLRKGKVVAVLN
jgi:hypothetical protein